MKGLAVFGFSILLSIFALTPVPIRAYSHACPRLSALTPAHSRLLQHTPTHADAQISTGEWPKPNFYATKQQLRIISKQAACFYSVIFT